MRFRRRLEQQTSASLVPMIDVVFQLVIFFMVSTTFRVAPGIDLVLPTSQTATPVEVSSVTITVAAEDEIYLDERLVSLDELESLIEAFEDRPDAVVVEGDRAVPYALMIQVLDVLRRQGLTGVNLRTRSPEP